MTSPMVDITELGEREREVKQKVPSRAMQVDFNTDKRGYSGYSELQYAGSIQLKSNTPLSVRQTLRTTLLGHPTGTRTAAVVPPI